MSFKRFFIVILVSIITVNIAGCGVTDERSIHINEVKSRLNYDQREISKIITAFFSHLVNLEVNHANRLIAESSPMRFTTQDHVKWNEEVGKNESRKQVIRDVIKDAPHYWDVILVEEEGKASFRYPPDPSNRMSWINSYCNVHLIKEGGEWKINTWEYGK